MASLNDSMDPLRSTDPLDYQRLAQPLALMRKAFAAGYRIPPHDHERDQLLYAGLGTMRVRTAGHSWTIPPDRALYVPAGLEHSLTMLGPVEMWTLYIAPDAAPALPRQAKVFAASELLRALIRALLNEPVVYEVGSRAHSMALLALDEIQSAEPLALAIPMPQDKRLLKLCEALLEAPESALSLDAWADRAGASRRTLARLFQSQCGLSFTVWRRRVRFHAAIDLLDKGIPIAEVARRHGYNSPSAFTAAFRRMFGQSPRAAVQTGEFAPR